MERDNRERSGPSDTQPDGHHQGNTTEDTLGRAGEASHAGAHEVAGQGEQPNQPEINVDEVLAQTRVESRDDIPPNDARAQMAERSRHPGGGSIDH